MQQRLASIAALHAQWRGGNGTPSTHLETTLELAARLNDQDRIYTQILQQRAVDSAQRAERTAAAGNGWPALLGVPVAVKDNIDIAGCDTTLGSELLARVNVQRSANIVESLDTAGAVIVGKTNMDEAALGASGRNPFYGRCINPRSPAMLTGGSSSGSAAAVAAGHCLLALGTDTLGSVRIPAALCGVSGFKPSHGVLSVAGVAPLYEAFDTLGLLANSLDDIEAAFAVLSGAPPGSRAAAPRASRVACLDATALSAVEPGIASAYLEAVAGLRRAGNIELTLFPRLDFAAVARAAFREVARAFADRLAASAHGGSDQLGAELREVLRWAGELPAIKLAAGRKLLRDAQAQFSLALNTCDAVLTPTCPVAAIDAAARVPSAIADFVAVANVTGSPAVCWPVTVAGAEFSLQLMATAGSDRKLLRVARDVQQQSAQS